jgi:hypothetical protein
MIKCSNLEKKKEKTKTRLIKAKVSNRSLFWHSRHHRIDGRTIKRGIIWLSSY